MFEADSINRLERGIRGIRALHLAMLLSTSLCLNSIALAGAGGAAEVSYRTVAVTGQPAPGTQPGVHFWVFIGPVIAQNGDVGFTARLIGEGVDATNRNGVWVERNGALELIVRSGTQAPGVETGAVFNGFASDYIPSPPSVTPTTVVFGGELTGPGINFTNGSGKWKTQDGQIVLVARNGAHAPGTPAGVYFTTVGGAGLRNESVTFFGTVAGPGVTANNNDGIWSDRSGALALIVREADPAPGTSPGVVFGGGVFGTGGYTFPGMAINQSSQLAVRANLLGSGVTAFNDEGVWAEANGALTLIAREGDPAPGTEPGVYIGSANGIAEIHSLSFNSAGHVLFASRLSPPFHQGIFSTRNGELELVMRTGFPAPGSGLIFSSFYSPRFNDAGKVAFHGSAGSIHGIWSDRAGGPLEPLVQSGQQIPGQTQGVTFSNSGINTFQPRAFNAAGQVLFTAGIVDPENGNSSALILDDPTTGLHLLATTGAEFDVFGDGSDMRTIASFITGGLGLLQDGQVAFHLDFTDGSSGQFVASIAVTQPCPADVDATGSVNVDDLLAVLSAWGPCARCAADIIGDGAVNVDDLLAVLSGWGPCPD